MPNSSGFSYLETEDSNFCDAFDISESAFLECFGGLKGYTQHRLDRADARRAIVASEQATVPHLPQSPEAALSHYKIEDKQLTNEALAGVIIKEQVDKVKGIIQSVKANKALKESAAKARQDDNSRVRMEAEYLAKSYADWPGDSGQRCLGMSDEQASEHKREIEVQKDMCIARAVHEIKARKSAL